MSDIEPASPETSIRRAVLLFTWNLHHNKQCLESACRYLAKRTPCVASLQELPEQASAQDIERYSKGRLRQVSLVDTRLWIVVSSELKTTEAVVYNACSIPQADRRMMEVMVTAPGLPKLRFVAVHLPNRRDMPHDMLRGSTVSALVGELRARPRDGSLIVAGDFNADPYHEEIAGRAYLWAVRDREELEKVRPTSLPGDPGLPIMHQGKIYASLTELHAKPTYGDRRPLYNPMWRWLAERRASPRGTYHFVDEVNGIPWRCYDQILLSSELIEYAGPARILDRLSKRDVLVTRKQAYPDGKSYSDHLPVQLTLTRNGTHV